MQSLVLKYFLNILGKRDYSEQSLREKAASKGHDLAEVNGAIEWLKEQNFVNDRRYAQSLVRSYAGRKGPFWIRQKMVQKGVSQNLADEVLSEFAAETETPTNQISDLVKAKLARKYGITDWQNVDFKTKQKLLSWASRNGFTLSGLFERDEG